MTTIDVPAAALAQLAYHIGCAANLAASSRSSESIPHAVMSWALLEAIGGAALDDAVHGFDLPDDVGDIRAPDAAPVRERAEELALQLCAHFTSEGRHDLAHLYQTAYELLTVRT